MDAGFDRVNLPDVRRDKRHIENAALEWVGTNFDKFKPQAHPDPKHIGFVTKAAAELGMICGLAATSALGTRTIPYRELAKRLWDEVFQQEGVQDYLLRNTGDVPSLGFYASMRQCGFEDRRYREQIARIIRSGYLAAIERPPSSELDFLFSLRLAGFDAPETEAVYRRSMLAHHPPPHLLSTDDVYTMTHVVFFTTEFGRTTPTFFTDADRHYFASAFPRLTGYFLRSNDWDLTAELLISLHATHTQTPVVAAAWDILGDAQNPDGSYDGPSDGKPTADPASDPDWVAFRDNYHTTLAVLLALLTIPSD